MIIVQCNVIVVNKYCTWHNSVLALSASVRTDQGLRLLQTGRKFVSFVTDCTAIPF